MQFVSRSLQEALRTKSSILCAKAKQDRQLQRLEATLQSLTSQREEIKKRKSEAEVHLQEAMSHKQFLLDGLQKETSRQQKVASEISELRAVQLRMEVALEENERAETERKNQVNQLKKEESEQVNRSCEAQANIEADISKKCTETSKLWETIKKQEDSVKHLETNLETARNRHIEVCKANEALVVLEETGLPSWDEVGANSFLEAEDKAIKEEEEAKDALDREQQELNALLDLHRSDEESLGKRTSELEQAEKEARAVEGTRQADNNKVLQQLAADKAETKSLIGKVERLRLLEEQREAHDRETALDLAKEIDGLEAENSAAEKANLELDAKAQEYEQHRKSEKEAHHLLISEKEEDIHRQENLIVKMHTEAAAIEESEAKEDEFEKIQADIARIIEGRLGPSFLSTVTAVLTSTSVFLSRISYFRVSHYNVRAGQVTRRSSKS